MTERQFEIDVTYRDGKSEVFLTRESTIREHTNIIEYVKSIIVKPLQKIMVNEVGKDRTQLCFDYTFETWMMNRTRIETINEPGYEDYTGYGNRTDGKRNRFYIGRSTGWLPIYLEILKSNSSGGGGLMHEHRTFHKVSYVSKHN